MNSGRRSAAPWQIFGGADRVRTDDLRLAKPALSQLSYSPDATLVGLGRFELPTSRLSGVRSNRLSYRPARASAWRTPREADDRSRAIGSAATQLGLSKPNSTRTRKRTPTDRTSPD